MNTLILFFILAVIVEAIIENAFESVPSHYKRYTALAVAMTLCVSYNADLLARLGLVAGVPYVGALITGVLISRGANVFNDLVNRLHLPRFELEFIDERDDDADDGDSSAVDPANPPGIGDQFKAMQERFRREQATAPQQVQDEIRQALAHEALRQTRRSRAPVMSDAEAERLFNEQTRV